MRGRCEATPWSEDGWGIVFKTAHYPGTAKDDNDKLAAQRLSSRRADGCCFRLVGRGGQPAIEAGCDGMA